MSILAFYTNTQLDEAEKYIRAHMARAWQDYHHSEYDDAQRHIDLARERADKVGLFAATADCLELRIRAELRAHSCIENDN